MSDQSICNLCKIIFCCEGLLRYSTSVKLDRQPCQHVIVVTVRGCDFVLGIFIYMLLNLHLLDLVSVH